MRWPADRLRGLVRGLVRPALSPAVPVRAQRAWVNLIARVNLVPRGVRVRSGSAGGVGGEQLTAGPARRTILYLHGGGYCLGSPAMVRSITARLARLCEAEVFAADYRLAPEHPFPAALEDVLSAYRGLAARGASAGELVIAGDSAGGGLALAAAARLRELGEALPGALVLLAPWVDLAPDGLGEAPGADPMLTRPWLDACARHYLGHHPAGDPRASPVHAELRGLPPLFIQVGGEDPLRPQAERAAALARAAGAAVELDVRPGLWHDFQLHAGLLAEADAALARVAAFVHKERPCAS